MIIIWVFLYLTLYLPSQSVSARAARRGPIRTATGRYKVWYKNTHMIIRGYHMGGSVIWFLSNEWWCDITNERGTSEWVISHQHEFDKIISQCHPCDYLFIIYHNTRTNRNFVHTYHSYIWYKHTLSLFNFTNYRLLELSNETTKHNALWRVVGKKSMEKKIQKKNSKFFFPKINSNLKKKKKSNFFSITKFHKKKISTFFPYKMSIVSHSSYHTRRITLPRYFRWNMKNIGAINITLVYDNIYYIHGTDSKRVLGVPKHSGGATRNSVGACSWQHRKVWYICIVFHRNTPWIDRNIRA